MPAPRPLPTDRDFLREARLDVTAVTLAVFAAVATPGAIGTLVLCLAKNGWL